MKSDRSRDLFPAAPRRGQRAPRSARKGVHRSGKIALTGLLRSQRGEIANDFLLTAGKQERPVPLWHRVLLDRCSEPCRHSAGPGFVCGIKPDLNLNPIAYTSIGSFADFFVQIEAKTAVTNGHHVDWPWLFWFAIDLDEHRHRPAPVLLQPCCPFLADRH